MSREPISKSLRFEVFKRDGFTCQYCGAKAPKAVLHADHIQPVASGGRSRLNNLATACDACNLGKLDHEVVCLRVEMISRAETVCDAMSRRFGRMAGRRAFPYVLRVLEYSAEFDFRVATGETMVEFDQRHLLEEIARPCTTEELFVGGLQDSIKGTEDYEASQREARHG